MKIARLFVPLIMLLASAIAQTTSPPVLSTPDDRLKADVLLIVAHPDDETGVAAYLAQLLDQHKRVAAVYLTHGEAGHNNMGPDRAASLGAVREMELRQAMRTLGVQNVWFLDGRDTPSQNVLQSLGNWGHGRALEEVVRMVRLTRPEVVLTWLPGVFIGENHGDHQAAGVLATEAFDLAGDPAAFPAQLAGPTKVNETLLEGLQPWQPKKIFYYSDAADEHRFRDSGPSYPSTAVSPTRKMPYWKIAVEVFRYHLTQYRSYIERLGTMTDQQIAANWSDPTQLIFGKSLVPGSKTGDVFEGVTAEPIPYTAPVREAGQAGRSAPLSAELGGPWGFYEQFRPVHGLKGLRVADPAEIRITRGTTLQIPLELHNYTGATQTINIAVKTPEGWSTQSGTGTLSVEKQAGYHATVTLLAPKTESSTVQDIECQAESGGHVIATIKLRVRVSATGLPQ